MICLGDSCQAEANVAFGLEELDIPAGERRARVQRFIVVTGLEGFERQMLWWTTNGFMKRTIPVRSIVDTSFVDEAAKAVPEP